MEIATMLIDTGIHTGTDYVNRLELSIVKKSLDHMLNIYTVLKQKETVNNVLQMYATRTLSGLAPMT